MALMGDVAASGGYYIAAACHTIMARPTTITGSIGVIISNYQFGEALKKIGIESRAIVSDDTPYKDMLSPTRPMRPDEERKIKAIVQEMYERFVDIVDQGRPELTRPEVKQLATGEIYSATRAEQIGLVDRVGNIDAAYAVLREMTDSEAFRVLEQRRIRPSSMRCSGCAPAGFAGRGGGATAAVVEWTEIDVTTGRVAADMDATPQLRALRRAGDDPRASAQAGSGPDRADPRWRATRTGCSCAGASTSSPRWGSWGCRSPRTAVVLGSVGWHSWSRSKRSLGPAARRLDCCYRKPVYAPRRWRGLAPASQACQAIAMGEKLAAFIGLESGVQARRDGDDYVLTGAATLVTAATEADLLVVAATADGEPVLCCIEAVGVERESGSALGFRASARRGRCGSTATASPLRRSWPPGGAPTRPSGGARLAAGIGGGAIAAGMAMASYEQARGHAHERIAFGKPLFAQQAVGHKLVECLRRAAPRGTWSTTRRGWPTPVRMPARRCFCPARGG